MGCKQLQLNDYFRFVGNESDIQYSECQHRKDRPTGFSFTYDTNGSQIGKVNSTANESYLYTYNLQNRLSTATINRMEDTSLVEITSNYLYNQSGIRVRSNSTQTVDGVATTKNRKYLLDAGMTGYAQVLEELDATNNSLVKSYTLGDDVLSQRAVGSGQSAVSYLLYDGHGSTRLLTNATSVIASRFDYDAYGKNLFSANVTNPSATDMLYSGEQFDTNLQMQYLRARYYDQNNERFNRVDPFSGNMGDPQSLHKYGYAHSNPVMGIDPTGKGWLPYIIGALVVIGLLGMVFLNEMYNQNFSPQGTGSSTNVLQTYFTGATNSDLLNNFTTFEATLTARGDVRRYLVTCNGGVIDLVHIMNSVRSVLGGQSRIDRLKKRWKGEQPPHLSSPDDLPSDGFGSLLGEKLSNGTETPSGVGMRFFGSLGIVDGRGTLNLRNKIIRSSISLSSSGHLTGRPLSVWNTIKSDMTSPPLTATGNIETDLKQAGFSLKKYNMGDDKNATMVEFVSKP